MRLSRYRGLIIVAAAVLAACASPAGPGNLTATELPSLTSPQPSPLTTPVKKSAEIEQAIADLTVRLGIPPTEISVFSQESAVWPNAGLGCPQPGVDYIEKPVDGLRIILSHAGIKYEYHTGPSRVVFCEKNDVRARLTAVPLSPLVPPAEGNTMTTTLKIEPGLQPLIDAATTDLVNRLAAARDAIEVVSAQSVVWPDRSLGCPQPGIGYIQVETDGFRIVLRVNDQLYAYHGGGGRGPFLCQSPAK